MHEHKSIQDKCGHMVEFLPWHLELNVDCYGAMLLVCCVGISMPLFESSTCFHVCFPLAASMVHKVFGAHPFALLSTTISLGSVNGDRKQF